MNELLGARTLVFQLRLPSHPISVSVARNVVRSLRPYLLDERSDRLELILSEVVTNAIRHGSPDPDDAVEVELSTTAGSLSGSVLDQGPTFTPPGPPTEIDQIGGFGLHIVAQLAESWSIESAPNGKLVRFTV